MGFEQGYRLTRHATVAAAFQHGPFADTAMMADTVARDLGWAAPHGDRVVVLGPAPAPMALPRGRLRRRMLLKVRRDVAIQPIFGLGWRP